MFTIKLVILTKSSKNGKNCVAGINLNTYDWIRLVSSNDECDGAISDNEMKDDRGQIATVFDIVEVMIERKAPIGCQTENYVVSAGYIWKHLGKMNLNQVLEVCNLNRSAYIFGNTYGYITEECMNEYNHSLLMAEVYDLKVFKNEFNKEKCNFSYKGRICRDLSVTDPEYYCYGECKMSRAYIIVSLPHKDYRGKYYKFVAKIFPQSPITVNDLSLLWTLGK